MAVITKTKAWVDAENVTYSDLNDNLDTLYNAVNGALDNDNISASAAIAATKIADTAVTLTATQTISGKTLTSPKVGTAIADTSGNELLKVTATASAVNELTLANAATGGNPTMTASGGDTNIGFDLKMKGTGVFRKPSLIQSQALSVLANVTVVDGVSYFRVPEELNGMNLTQAGATVLTAGTTNATTFDIYNVTDSTTMLSANLSIASGDTASGAASIDATKDDVATGDIIRLDTKAVSTTAPKGLIWWMRFSLPA